MLGLDKRSQEPGNCAAMLYGSGAVAPIFYGSRYMLELNAIIGIRTSTILAIHIIDRTP